MTYEIGDIVIARPNWPTQPAFGIWTNDIELVTNGKPAQITGIRSAGIYSVQFVGLADRKVTR